MNANYCPGRHPCSPYPRPSPLFLYKSEVVPAGKTIHNRVPHELFTLVPVVLSTIVAIMLTVIAFFSVDDSAVLICQRIVPLSVPIDLTGFINALLLTITIIVLFETVTGYFKTKLVEVR